MQIAISSFYVRGRGIFILIKPQVGLGSDPDPTGSGSDPRPTPNKKSTTSQLVNFIRRGASQGRGKSFVVRQNIVPPCQLDHSCVWQ